MVLRKEENDVNFSEAEIPEANFTGYALPWYLVPMNE
jgi:hypothetical protein